MSETTQAPPAAGTFCWNEVMTTNGAAARTFYTELFGWGTEEMDMGPAGIYTLYTKGETQVGGMMEMKGEQFEGVPPHWLSYIAVDDTDATTAKAQSLGANVCCPPTDIPNIGRFSVLADPTGAVFAIFQKVDAPADCG